VIRTERLTLVPWESAHAEPLAELARDPVVMRHVGSGATWSAEQARAISEKHLRHWREHGFGWHAVLDGASGDVVGFAGVAFAGENPGGLDPREYELGCWVDPRHWRRGYAAEASRAVLDDAFRRVGAESVIVSIRSDHEASIAGAKSLGFEYERAVGWGPGVEAVIYRLSAPAAFRAGQRDASAPPG
jgi:RimJ/RimL family protein N-acetyltransferase